MAEIKIKFQGKDVLVRKITGFSRALPGQIKKGFVRAGAIFERDMKIKLSGPSHSLGGGSGNPYPGVVSNTLRPSVTADVKRSITGFTLRVGPGGHAKIYAPYLEFGTRNMPAYPFVGPTLEAQADNALDAIQEEIAKPLDR